MPRQAPKTSQRAHSHTFYPVTDTMKSVQQVQEKVLEFGHENMESLVHTAERVGKAMVDSSNLYAREMQVAAKSTSIPGGTLRALSTMMMQGATLSFSHGAAFVRDAMKCGSIEDLHALQEDYTHRMADDYFHEANKFYEALFDSYVESLDPVTECVAEAVTYTRKALAA